MDNGKTFEISLEVVRAYILLQLYANHLVPSHGVETSELHIMFRLSEGGPMSQAALGRAVVRDAMSVSRRVRSLEERGLVTRAIGNDTRERRVNLTPRGKRVLAQVITSLEEGEPFQGWSKRDLQTLRKLLARLVGSMRDACDRVALTPERRE